MALGCRKIAFFDVKDFNPLGASYSKLSGLKENVT